MQKCNIITKNPFVPFISFFFLKFEIVINVSFLVKTFVLHDEIRGYQKMIENLCKKIGIKLECKHQLGRCHGIVHITLFFSLKIKNKNFKDYTKQNKLQVFI